MVEVLSILITIAITLAAVIAVAPVVILMWLIITTLFV